MANGRAGSQGGARNSQPNNLGANGKELLPAYLVVGTDELRRNRVVARLKGRLDEGLAAFNLDERVARGDMEPTELLSSLNTLPMGAPFRLVVVSQADHLPKPVSESIITYLKNPNHDCVLLLVADSLSKGTRLYKAVAKLGKSAIISCEQKKSWELPGYVVSEARRQGIQIDQQAAQELVDRVGESTTMLDRQLRSLWDLCRGQGRISLEDVRNNVARVAEVKPWGFLDAVCNRDAKQALSLYNLMRNPSEIALLSLLCGRIRELICAKSLDARGMGSQLSSELHRQSWQVKNHRRWAGRFRPGELERALMDCATCDAALKSGANPKTAFTRLYREHLRRGRGFRLQLGL